MTLNEKFHFAKLSLFNMRLLNNLQTSDNTSVKNIVECEADINNLSKPVPLLHQASFLSHAYINLVWLWEVMKSENLEDKIINEVKENYDLEQIEIREQGSARTFNNERDYLRLIRNSISHGNVVVDDNKFIFADKNPRNPNDFGKLSLTWESLGKLSDCVLISVNRHLYPDFYKEE